MTQDPRGPADRPDAGVPASGQGSGTRRSPLPLLLGAFLAVAVAVTGVVLVGGNQPFSDPGAAVAPTEAADSPAAPRRTVDPKAARTAALGGLLATRAEALLSRDREAWLATVDPASTEFAARQKSVFDNLEQVPFTSLRFEPAGDGPALETERSRQVGPDAWVTRVMTVYRLADGDDGDVRREQYLTLVQRNGTWLVADDADGERTPDIWDLGPVEVVRGERTLVLGTADRDMLQTVADQADEAASEVDAVWGVQWSRRVVVIVPRDQTEMAELLVRPDETGLDQIAAVTTGEIGSNQQTTADRVIVNPTSFGQLGEVGRAVVLAHEITHVAARASGGSGVPIWLSEGFADYVAYRDRDLSRRQVAGDVLELVARGEGPRALATQADFDPATGQIAPAYSSSWLAVEMIAREWSEQELVELYRTVDGTTASGRPAADPVPVEVAVPQVLGTTLPELEQQWLRYLEDLAG